MRPRGIPNGARTEEAWRFILAHHAEQGVVPHARAIAAHMGWASHMSATDTLSRLVIHGRLRRSRRMVDGRHVHVYEITGETP